MEHEESRKRAASGAENVSFLSSQVNERLKERQVLQRSLKAEAEVFLKFMEVQVGELTRAKEILVRTCEDFDNKLQECDAKFETESKLTFDFVSKMSGLEMTLNEKVRKLQNALQFSYAQLDCSGNQNS